MKLVLFKDIKPGQRFWTDTFDDEELVEHIKLYEETDEWNCVELSEGRLGLILNEQVYVKEFPQEFDKVN